LALVAWFQSSALAWLTAVAVINQPCAAPQSRRGDDGAMRIPFVAALIGALMPAEEQAEACPLK
jgi:hypothetical protein